VRLKMAARSMKNSQARNHFYCGSGLKNQYYCFIFHHIILAVVKKYKLALSLKTAASWLRQ
jgi:hypothetical protein